MEKGNSEEDDKKKQENFDKKKKEFLEKAKAFKACRPDADDKTKEMDKLVLEECSRAYQEMLEALREADEKWTKEMEEAEIQLNLDRLSYGLSKVLRDGVSPRPKEDPVVNEKHLAEEIGVMDPTPFPREYFENLPHPDYHRVALPKKNLKLNLNLNLKLKTKTKLKPKPMLKNYPTKVYKGSV